VAHFARNGGSLSPEYTNQIDLTDNVYQNTTALVHFGAATVISKYHKAHPELLKEEPVAMIEKLRAIAINEKPLDIGKPVSIVEVTPKGINWIKKNSCALKQ